MLKITFLGTGTSQGIPIIGSKHPVCLSDNQKDKRLRVSIALEWEDGFFVIDCGPDFRQQMLRLNPSRLDGILFTHEHADHTAGMDDIRPFFFRQGKIDLFMTSDVHASLKQRFGYIMNDENKYPGAPSVNVKQISKTNPFVLNNKTVIPIEVMHHKLPVTGYRFDDFAYLTDVKTIAAEEKEKLTGLDVLVLSALRIDPHPSHLNLEEALILIDELKPKRTYLTHISHLLGFHDEVQASLPENVFLAYDTLQITTNE
ncbi:MBL fold metallo-hydrolase [Flavobacteriaceae bacterium]|nr:MBL fold metallo-hydrolase [Flavobacteriaceae bacterium]